MVNLDWRSPGWPQPEVRSFFGALEYIYLTYQESPVPVTGRLAVGAQESRLLLGFERIRAPGVGTLQGLSALDEALTVLIPVQTVLLVG